jgi:hypothetical protein
MASYPLTKGLGSEEGAPHGAAFAPRTLLKVGTSVIGDHPFRAARKRDEADDSQVSIERNPERTEFPGSAKRQAAGE